MIVVIRKSHRSSARICVACVDDWQPLVTPLSLWPWVNQVRWNIGSTITRTLIRIAFSAGATIHAASCVCVCGPVGQWIGHGRRLWVGGWLRGEGLEWRRVSGGGGGISGDRAAGLRGRCKSVMTTIVYLRALPAPAMHVEYSAMTQAC